MSTIRGKQSATLNSEEIRYDPQNGWSGSWTQEGPKEAVRPLLQQLAALGYSFVYNTDQNPKGIVRYSTVGAIEPGVAEQPALTWEFFANSAEIDVLETDLSTVAAISDDDKRKIRNAISSPDPDSSPSISGTDAITLYQLMLGGVRSFRINIPTLRVSKLVSGSYPVRASMTNVGRIITTNTLSIQEAIPSTILFELPNYSTAKAGFYYAWYKKHPNVQQSGGNKWNVSQEWEYGLWPTFLYQSAL